MSDYMENGIPFRMTLPKEPYRAEKGYRAMVELSEESEKNGLIEDEIPDEKDVVTPREMLDIIHN